MNRAVYTHFLSTFGKRPGIWIGFVAELVRTLAARVLIVVFMAQAVSSLASGNIAEAQQNVIYFLVVSIVGSVVGALGELIAIQGENAQYETQLRVYHRKLTGKDMAFYRDHQTGYLASMFRQYVDGLMELSRLLRRDIMPIIVSLIAPAFVLWVADWRLGMVTVGLIVLQMAYIAWASARSNKYRVRSHEVYRKLTAEMSDEITNIVAFKAGGHEEAAYDKIRDLAKEETKVFWLRQKVTNLLDLPRDILTAIGISVAFWLALPTTGQYAETTGLMVLTITYMFQVIRNVRQLPGVLVRLDDTITKAYPALSYLGEEHETIKDSAHPKKLRITKGAITIKEVHFAYPAHADSPRDILVFKNFNLRVKGGERVGIVGLSGAGKCTLASLLMRFDDVDSGSISIDGMDIRDVSQSDLRRHIAYVPQEPLLFHRTIRENIMYFNGNAAEEDVVRAAKAAHAHEFIVKLPNGYDTIVGERGVKLSGGQKQRVVIARAILKNAPIMIFDEATSALDTESEQIIQQALPRIIGRHTAIVVAHRLSTVASLDRIVVLHDGEIIESGAHDELYAKKGRYYSLWQKQAAPGRP